MPPIHVAGEMAVWSEEKWAAFEGDLQRRLRSERRRLERLAQGRQRSHFLLKEAAVWGVLAAVVLLIVFF